VYLGLFMTGTRPDLHPDVCWKVYLYARYNAGVQVDVQVCFRAMWYVMLRTMTQLPINSRSSGVYVPIW
jgi:hypothetical protein